MIDRAFFEALQTELKGSIRFDAPLAPTSWFKVGGPADILFKPADKQDLITFLTHCPKDVPITTLGASSNIIIRDKGIRGIVIKLGKAFAQIEKTDDLILTAGAFALDANVANVAAKEGLDGFAFLSGIPGTIGGAIKMNAGAYGSEIKDVLVDAEIITHEGAVKIITGDDIQMRYRHTELPQEAIVTLVRLKATGLTDREILQNHIQEIKEKRNQTQPITEKTSGSTFANPTVEECEAAGHPLMKAWELIQQSGADQIIIGDATMSDKHRNFMINRGQATAHNLETLGEEVRKKVYEQFGIRLRWEIRRIGEA